MEHIMTWPQPRIVPTASVRQPPPASRPPRPAGVACGQSWLRWLQPTTNWPSIGPMRDTARVDLTEAHR